MGSGWWGGKGSELPVCVCVCVCVCCVCVNTQRERIQPGRPGVREERSPSVGGRLNKQGILLLLSKLYRFLLARQLCECE